MHCNEICNIMTTYRIKKSRADEGIVLGCGVVLPQTVLTPARQ